MSPSLITFTKLLKFNTVEHHWYEHGEHKLPLRANNILDTISYTVHTVMLISPVKKIYD